MTTGQRHRNCGRVQSKISKLSFLHRSIDADAGDRTAAFLVHPGQGVRNVARCVVLFQRNEMSSGAEMNVARAKPIYNRTYVLHLGLHGRFVLDVSARPRPPNIAEIVLLPAAFPMRAPRKRASAASEGSRTAPGHSSGLAGGRQEHQKAPTPRERLGARQTST